MAPNTKICAILKYPLTQDLKLDEEVPNTWTCTLLEQSLKQRLTHYHAY